MESTLSLKRKDFLAGLGLSLGYGRGADFGEKAWDVRTASILDQFVSSGLRRFYKPPRLTPQEISHDWSFLHPMASLVLPSGESTVRLPDDFEGVEGQIAIQGDARQWWPLDIYNEGLVEQRHSTYPDNTGPPQIGAMAPVKGTTLTEGSRTNLRVWPIADQDYTLRFQYYYSPEALSGSRPYAIGGTEHSETILASCKAAAELDLDDIVNGPQWQKFMSCLATSIDIDRRKQPQKLGYNADNSDVRRGRRRPQWWHDGVNPVTIGGVIST